MVLTVKLVYDDIFLFGDVCEVGLIPGEPELHVLRDPVVSKVPVPRVRSGAITTSLSRRKPRVPERKSAGLIDSRNRYIYRNFVFLFSFSMN
jgi:hypothetical protein